MANNKYIKLLEEFNPEEDLDPIMPVEEKEEEEESLGELDVLPIENTEGTTQYYVIDMDNKKAVAGPFVEHADAVREIEVMQSKQAPKEDEEELEEGRGQGVDATDLIFTAAQYTEEDLEPLAGQQWDNVDDIVDHILDYIKDEADKVKFLKDAKERYPELTITA